MVPEGRGVFTRMSILENLQMGAYTRNDKAGIAADIEQVVRRLSAAEGARGASWPARCPAASSRCWRWRAR